MKEISDRVKFICRFSHTELAGFLVVDRRCVCKQPFELLWASTDRYRASESLEAHIESLTEEQFIEHVVLLEMQR
jgi:hypothetical protein